MKPNRAAHFWLTYAFTVLALIACVAPVILM